MIVHEERCYFKNEPLDGSEEHIIPNSLGGKRTSKHLLCKKCNTVVLEPLDRELGNQLGIFTSLLNLDRDRPRNNNTVYFVDSEGKKIPVEITSEGFFPHKKLTVTYPNGKSEEVRVRDENQFILNLQKSTKKKYVKTNEGQENLPQLFFQNHLSTKPGELGFGGKMFYKGICKIAINFFLYRRAGTKDDLKGALTFISNHYNGPNRIVTPYYPINFKPFEKTNDEFLHLLYLKCDSKYKLIYAYIELFSTFNFLILLSDLYNGPDVVKTECFDLLQQKYIQKNVEIKLDKQDFLNLVPLFYDNQYMKQRETEVFNNLLNFIKSKASN